MPDKRIVFTGYMTVEGFHIELTDVDLEGGNSKTVALSLPPAFMDDFAKHWQEFKDGMNERHLLMYRNYFDDHPDMSWVRYMCMDDKKKKE